jgi:hypothetical protein
VSDIDTVVVDSLKALDPEWPIREADMRAITSMRPLCATSGLVACETAWLGPLLRRFCKEAFRIAIRVPPRRLPG